MVVGDSQLVAVDFDRNLFFLETWGSNEANATAISGPTLEDGKLITKISFSEGGHYGPAHLSQEDFLGWLRTMCCEWASGQSKSRETYTRYLQND